MSSEDWRFAEDNATIYFGHQQKRVATEQRRPVIRKASDLVGPGINSNAVRITDYNDPLATFNGYFSSEPGALYAPNTTDPFIGTVISDETLGGQQVFRSLVSGNEYTRVFLRNPSDPATVVFSVWTTPEITPPGVYASEDYPAGRSVTPLPQNVMTDLTMPNMRFVGDEDTYVRTTNSLVIQRPGQYTGYAWLFATDNIYIANTLIEYPDGDKQTSDLLINQPGSWSIRFPLHFQTNLTTGFIKISAMQQTEASPVDMYFWRLHLTRIGN